MPEYFNYHCFRISLIFVIILFSLILLIKFSFQDEQINLSYNLWKRRTKRQDLTNDHAELLKETLNTFKDTFNQINPEQNNFPSNPLDNYIRPSSNIQFYNMPLQPQKKIESDCETKLNYSHHINVIQDEYNKIKISLDELNNKITQIGIAKENSSKINEINTTIDGKILKNHSNIDPEFARIVNPLKSIDKNTPSNENVEEMPKNLQQSPFNSFWPKYPICSYNPSLKSTAPGSMLFPNPAEMVSAHINPRYHPVYLPQQYPWYQLNQRPNLNHYPFFVTSPGNIKYPPSAPLYGPYGHFNPLVPCFCNFFPTSNSNFPSLSGTGPGGNFRQNDISKNNEELILENSFEETKRLDDIDLDCKWCTDKLKCLQLDLWCDANMDCLDKSDETNCSCLYRIDKSRICDGYIDCPQGEDESECFGCPNGMFSCEDQVEDKLKSTCLPLEKKCNNFRDCKNGRDEHECILLNNQVTNNKLVHQSFLEGFLHRNWKGKWYPVCQGFHHWAIEACQKELGYHLRSEHVVETKKQIENNYSGLYLNVTPIHKINFIKDCWKQATYVTCKKLQCGTRVFVENEILEKERFKRFETGLIGNPNIHFDIFKENEEMNKRTLRSGKVVGGGSSLPGAWPWIIALFRDGSFHCGGVIISDIWILSAAHCVEKYEDHYYEAVGGLLRRLSFSPTSQRRFIIAIIIHLDYNRSNMRNDLALLRMDNKFHYNRWIRPICLPNLFRARRGFPTPGTMCTAVGWGSTKEHGPDPDQLREVEVPILPHCKHITDELGFELCAGFEEGGRDTCQGDSGGPLLCRVEENPEQWYVAGIVSHGEGCARPKEPGAYTRVSRFIDWILANTENSSFSEMRPKDKCPGFQCKSGSAECISKWKMCNNIVDCLKAEDEVDCPIFSDFDEQGILFSQNNNQLNEFSKMGEDEFNYLNGSKFYQNISNAFSETIIKNNLNLSHTETLYPLRKNSEILLNNNLNSSTNHSISNFSNINDSKLINSNGEIFKDSKLSVSDEKNNSPTVFISTLLTTIPDKSISLLNSFQDSSLEFSSVKNIFTTESTIKENSYLTSSNPFEILENYTPRSSNKIIPNIFLIPKTSNITITAKNRHSTNGTIFHKNFSFHNIITTQSTPFLSKNISFASTSTDQKLNISSQNVSFIEKSIFFPNNSTFLELNLNPSEPVILSNESSDMTDPSRIIKNNTNSTDKDFVLPLNNNNNEEIIANRFLPNKNFDKELIFHNNNLEKLKNINSSNFLKENFNKHFSNINDTITSNSSTSNITNIFFVSTIPISTILEETRIPIMNESKDLNISQENLLLHKKLTTASTPLHFEKISLSQTFSPQDISSKINNLIVEKPLLDSTNSLMVTPEMDEFSDSHNSITPFNSTISNKIQIDFNSTNKNIDPQLSFLNNNNNNMEEMRNNRSLTFNELLNINMLKSNLSLSNITNNFSTPTIPIMEGNMTDLISNSNEINISQITPIFNDNISTLQPTFILSKNISLSSTTLAQQFSSNNISNFGNSLLEKPLISPNNTSFTISESELVEFLHLNGSDLITPSPNTTLPTIINSNTKIIDQQLTINNNLEKIKNNITLNSLNNQSNQHFSNINKIVSNSSSPNILNNFITSTTTFTEKNNMHLINVSEEINMSQGNLVFHNSLTTPSTSFNSENISLASTIQVEEQNISNKNLSNMENPFPEKLDFNIPLMDDSFHRNHSDLTSQSSNTTILTKIRENINLTDGNIMQQTFNSDEIQNNSLILINANSNQSFSNKNLILSNSSSPNSLNHSLTTISPNTITDLLTNSKIFQNNLTHQNNFTKENISSSLVPSQKINNSSKNDSLSKLGNSQLEINSNFSTNSITILTTPNIENLSKTFTFDKTTESPLFIQSTQVKIELTTIITDKPLNLNSTDEISYETSYSYQKEINNELISSQNHFQCKIMNQTISKDKHCDRIINCQDGTDEEDCTCRDILISGNPDTICDGIVDCIDGNDEKNCGCLNEEYLCKKSHKCIPRNQICNFYNDCPLADDESDCFALTDGVSLVMDHNGRSDLRDFGILSYQRENKWFPLCNNEVEWDLALASDICLYLGFSGYKSFERINVLNESYAIISFDEYKKNNRSKNFIFSTVGQKPDGNICETLLLRCSLNPGCESEKVFDDYGVPWQASIFVDGHLKCLASILSEKWVLAHASCIPNYNELYVSIIFVVVGNTKFNLKISNPIHRGYRVNQIVFVEESSLQLFYLENPIGFSRYVRPIPILENTSFPEKCLLLGRDSENTIRKLYLLPETYYCPSNSNCFKLFNNASCKNYTEIVWDGPVSCFSHNEWKLTTIFENSSYFCSQIEKNELPLSLPNLDNVFSKINYILEMSPPVINAPFCPGFICPSSGQCIMESFICNGKPDCLFAEDEDILFCKQRKKDCKWCPCLPSEMRCSTTGKCISKSAFCNGIPDCLDASDEPNNCTQNCAAFLNLTSPHFLCDGILHCLDRSDESPFLCRCTPNNFKCEKSGDLCIAKEAVCDMKNDCPYGEDESICFGLNTEPFSKNRGILMFRSRGEWQVYCNGSKNIDMNKLCRSLGFQDMLTFWENNNTTTWIPTIYDQPNFSPVVFNNNLTMWLRDEPYLNSLLRLSKNSTCTYLNLICNP